MASLKITHSLSLPLDEVRFLASRSSGPGGQNVNRVATKIELMFDVRNSPSLTDAQRETVLRKLSHRIDTRGILHIASQESRSQWKNREAAIERFCDLLARALVPPKKRKPTHATASSKEKRLRLKKRRSDRKDSRKVPSEE